MAENNIFNNIQNVWKNFFPEKPVVQQILEQSDGDMSLLTAKSAKEIFGEKKGKKLWQQIQETKKRFLGLFPDETFPPIFVACRGSFVDNAAYTSNELVKKDWFGKRDTSEKYEAVTLGKQFIENKSTDEIIAILCHELGHDAKNHSNQRAKLRNEGRSLLPAQKRQQECEADALEVKLAGKKEPSIKELLGNADRDSNQITADPSSTHPERKDRVEMMKMPHIMMADLNRIHLNDKCEIVDKPFTPENTPSSLQKNPKNRG
jgi:hypothetical protein